MELGKYVKMNLDDRYQVRKSQLYSNMLNAEITARDREKLLEVAANEGNVNLYSESQYSRIQNNKKITYTV